MDILEKRSMEITSLALTGLANRHKAISSNVANAESENYKKVGVTFEDQLRQIIDTEDRKEQYKLGNSLSRDRQPYREGKSDMAYKDFDPTLIVSEAESTDGNNVNIEEEMSNLAKTGMRYNALATLQQKAFQGMKEVIQKGGN